MDIQSSGSQGDNHRNEMIEPQSPNEKEDLFDKFLNLNISNIQDQQNYYHHQVKTERRHNKRIDFRKILNSSSSNQRLIPSSPLKGSSRENSLRDRNYFQTQNSMDQQTLRKNFKKRQEDSFSVQNTIRDSSSSFSEMSDSRSIKNILPLDFRQQQVMEAEDEKFGCNCKRSKCLKLYCQCFQRQLFCNENCKCHDCGNRLQNSQRHRKAVIQALGRNAHGFQEQKRGQIKQMNQRQGFSLGVQIQEVKKGCKCRKTHCIKKYCECYQNGVHCGIFCRCQDCYNRNFYQKKN